MYIHMYIYIFCIPTYSAFVSHYMGHGQQLDDTHPYWTCTNQFLSATVYADVWIPSFALRWPPCIPYRLYIYIYIFNYIYIYVYKWFVCIYIYITQPYGNIFGYPLWFVAHFPPLFVSIIASLADPWLRKEKPLGRTSSCQAGWGACRAGGTSQDFIYSL